MYSLQEKVVVITGASGGIGARLAHLGRARGVKLALAARDETRLRAITGDDALAVAGDLTSEDTRRRLVEETAARFGRIDVLINNAGRGSYHPALEQPLDDARSMFELNVFAPMHLTQLALPYLRQSRGVVVNISSIAGRITLPWFPLYSASKFALTSLSETQRIELRCHGIHLLTVFPGYVNTEFEASAAGPAPPPETLRGRKFSVSVEECAEAIVAGIEGRKDTVVTPRSGRALLWFHRMGLV